VFIFNSSLLCYEDNKLTEACRGIKTIVYRDTELDKERKNLACSGWRNK
jgi:hypothetical protein